MHMLKMIRIRLFFFTLNDLFCTYVSSFGDQQSQFKFEVAVRKITMKEE